MKERKFKIGSIVKISNTSGLFKIISYETYSKSIKLEVLTSYKMSKTGRYAKVVEHVWSNNENMMSVLKYSLLHL